MLLAAGAWTPPISYLALLHTREPAPDPRHAAIPQCAGGCNWDKESVANRVALPARATMSRPRAHA